MPAITELIRLIISADIRIDNMVSWNMHVINQLVDKIIPFNIDTANSLLNNHRIFEVFIC